MVSSCNTTPCTNNTTTFPYTLCNTTLSYLPDKQWKYTFGALCIAVAFLATIENLVVIIIICRNKILQTPSHMILLSLAVSNFLTGLVLSPLYAAQLLHPLVLRLCNVDMGRRYLSAVFLGSALFTVGFISYDRCLHLVQLKQYNMPKKKMVPILLLCWFIPIIVPLFRYLGDNESVYAIIVIAMGSVMLSVVVISYIALMAALSRHMRAKENKMFRSHMSAERKAGRTVVMIVAISFFVGTPLLVYFGLVLKGDHDEVFLSKTYVFVMFLSMINAVLNPLVYCYRTPLLLKYTKKLFGMNTDLAYSQEGSHSKDTIRTFSR